MLLFTRNHKNFTLKKIQRLLSSDFETTLREGHVGLLWAKSDSVAAQISVDEGKEEITFLFRDFESQRQDFQDFVNSAKPAQLLHMTANGEPAAVEEFLQIFIDAGMANYVIVDGTTVLALDEFPGIEDESERSSPEVPDHSTGPSFLLRPADRSSVKTKFGGVPRNVSAFEWPVCGACQGNMLFVGQIRLAETQIESLAKRGQTVLVFQCTNSPGMCDDWEADAGGNAAIVVRNGRKTVRPPNGGETTIDEMLIQLSAHDASACTETDDDNYVAAYESGDEIVGKVGGNPVWVQADETPSCECGKAMRFVGLLEECGGLAFGGGGAGYIFVCEDCKSTAKFLWQC